MTTAETLKCSSCIKIRIIYLYIIHLFNSLPWSNYPTYITVLSLAAKHVSGVKLENVPKSRKVKSELGCIEFEANGKVYRLHVKNYQVRN